MAEVARYGWRPDPYRRHDLRYWDGRAWTAHICDLGVVGEDPVFPVPDDGARAFLAPSRARHRLTGVQRAAALAIGGFLAVVTLAAASSASAGDDAATAPSGAGPSISRAAAGSGQR